MQPIAVAMMLIQKAIVLSMCTKVDKYAEKNIMHTPIVANITDAIFLLDGAV